MQGTRLNHVLLSKVIDGDTIKVEIEGRQESLRLLCLDTEESLAGGSKPVTNAGKQASSWAKSWFGVDEKGLPHGEIRVDIEFDSSDSVAQCMEKQRGNYGRLLCYVLKNEENFNLTAVKEGWSPYFMKYGRSLLYHVEFIAAETNAHASNLGVWDRSANAGGESRDYEKLLPWWHMRGSLVEDFLNYGVQAGAKSVHLDYGELMEAAHSNGTVCVFCDLQGGTQQWPGDGAVIYAGSPAQKFNLWVPDRYAAAGSQILRFIQHRYAGYGRGYLYVTGVAELYRDTPQIVLTSLDQLSDLPPARP